MPTGRQEWRVDGETMKPRECVACADSCDCARSKRYPSLLPSRPARGHVKYEPRRDQKHANRLQSYGAFESINRARAAMDRLLLSLLRLLLLLLILALSLTSASTRGRKCKTKFSSPQVSSPVSSSRINCDGRDAIENGSEERSAARARRPTDGLIPQSYIHIKHNSSCWLRLGLKVITGKNKKNASRNENAKKAMIRKRFNSRMTAYKLN